MVEDGWSRLCLIGYFVPIFLVGMSGNIWVISSVVRILNRTRSPLNYTLRHMAMYILSLSIADMAVLCMIPMLLSYFYDGLWHFGLFGCKVFFTVENTNKLLSVAILTVMSFERFMAVSRPFSWCCCRNRPRPAASVSGVVLSLLLLILLLCSPMIYYAELKPLQLSYSDGGSEVSAQMVCGSNLPDKVMSMFICYMLVLGFVLPLLFISLCYFFLIQHLRNTRSAVTSRPSGQSMFVAACTTKVVRSVLRVVGFHMICWGPFWLFVFIPILEHFQPLHLAQTFDGVILRSLRMVSSFLPYLNSAGNWVFYAVMNRELREAISMCWGGGGRYSPATHPHTVGTPLISLFPPQTPVDSVRRRNFISGPNAQNRGSARSSGTGSLLLRALSRRMECASRRRCVSAEGSQPPHALVPPSREGEQQFDTMTEML